MDKLVYRTLLLDFYGELLTERQRKIYGLHFLEDLSLGEIAEEFDISKQAVWDLVNRTEKLLKNFDDKLHLVAEHDKLKSAILCLKQQIEEHMDNPQTRRIMHTIADEIWKEGN